MNKRQLKKMLKNQKIVSMLDKKGDKLIPCNIDRAVNLFNKKMVKIVFSNKEISLKIK